MNDAAREVLVAAALRGHRQIRKRMHDPSDQTGECALGVFHLALHPTREEALICWLACEHHDFDLTSRFGITLAEASAITIANDRDGWDFLQIATKIGVPQEAP